MIEVIIFSDIRIYCEGLTHILSKVDRLRVVGAESHFDDAIDKIGQLNPNVILLDMTMSGSCQAARTILQHFPDAHIVALAASGDENQVIRCAEAGVAGYVAREASLDELIETVKSARRGEVCYPPKVARFIFNRLRQVAWPVAGIEEAKSTYRLNSLHSVLTNREQQVVDLMSKAQSNKQIARILSIEVSTVKNHVHNILVKLDLKSRAQVVSQLQRSTVSTGSRSFGLAQKLEMPL